MLPENLPEDALPPLLRGLLDGKSFRHLHRTTLRTPKGREVTLDIPTAAYTPQQAVQLLAQLAIFDLETPATPTAERDYLAPDLLWLIHAYLGLDRFVRAGRLVLRTRWEDSKWWPQWQLVTGLGELGWIAEMTAAAPGVLIANGGSGVMEDMADELPHWIANAYLKALYELPRPYPWHDFTESLLSSTPIRRGGPQLVTQLKAWKESLTSSDVSLVVIVEEPVSEETPADDRGWFVRLQVRLDADSPSPVRFTQLDGATKKLVERGYQRITDIAPVLADDAGLSHARAAAFHQPGENSGDLDVSLTTDQMVSFITKDVARIRATGFVVMLPKAWSTYEPKMRLDLSEPCDRAIAPTKSTIGLDQLVQYDWKISIGDVELTDAEMAEIVSAKAGLINLRGRWVMADTDALNKIASYVEELSKSSRKNVKKRMETAMMEAQLARANNDPRADQLEEKAQELLEQFNKGLENTAQVTLAQLRELALKLSDDYPVEFTGTGWQNSLLGGTNTPAPERLPVPDTVRAHLREYQRRGVDWLAWMSENNLGAVLADDMGLGKTIQLLTLLAIEKEKHPDRGPTLVVCPTSVVGNWIAEATKFVPSLKTMTHHGSDRYAGEEFLAKARAMDLVVTSYGVVTRDFKLLGKLEWDRVVLDEAQAIKNSGTRASQSVRSLPSRHRVALTGTPVENRLSEMRSILDFCNPGVLGSASFFRNHFAKAIERENDEAMTQRLRDLTAPFILRRLKTDPAVIDDLPEKSEEILTVDMTTEQAGLYTALVEDIQQKLASAEGMAKRGLVLSTITRIKQICNHPAHYLQDGSLITRRGKHRSGKVKALMELVKTCTENDEKMLIFTQYKAFGDLLVPYLSGRLSRDIPFLHGGVSKTGRDKMVAEFQSPDGPPAMVLSLKAGGTGLNLTAANVVVHMDRWWNPAVENQATDRAFRIGQLREVRVYKMITRGTMEESIQDILDGKMHLASAIVGEGEGWITELSPDDLALLMSYRGRDT
ncbi:ATP-dependent helicase HepA [Corynebacterium kalinowskii]|uniref:ATP-dependent helicase HepA n=2 Tax=Corynebacterium kalinowskii TaxID=2675216 RepID=A0A6B8VSQ2_9CORY|nr:ATP-dependent helicase HepA [Corynebacterium kalinowskii]